MPNLDTRYLTGIEGLTDAYYRALQDLVIVASGRRESRDGDSWTHWWLLQGPINDQDALYLCGNPSPYYHGPGRGFGGEPIIRRNRFHRTLVTWHTGLDI